MVLDSDGLWFTDAVGGAVAFTSLNEIYAGVLAAGQSAPTGITTDANYVYWTNAGNGGVMRVAKGGGAPTTLASGQSSPTNLVTDGSYLYWSNAGTHELQMMPIGGGNIKTLLSTTSPASFAVDGSDVYVSTPTDGATHFTAGVQYGGLWDGKGASLNMALANGYIYVAKQTDLWASTELGGPGAILATSSAPTFVAVQGMSLYWSDNVPNGNVYVTDAILGGVSTAFARVGGIPGPIAANQTEVFWGTDTGVIYRGNRN